MGKRSDFERVPRDYYQTPIAAVRPLVPFLPPSIFTFVEPCAGDGRLISHIEELCPYSHCAHAYDIEPDPKPYLGKEFDIEQSDFKDIPTEFDMHIDYVITNPPWSRDKKSGYILHRMIEKFVEIAPTWLLFDSDWMHTSQAQPYTSKYLDKVVSIGRVKWIEDSKMTGKDNCCWYLFDKDARQHSDVPTFFGRGISPKV